MLFSTWAHTNTHTEKAKKGEEENKELDSTKHIVNLERTNEARIGCGQKVIRLREIVNFSLYVSIWRRLHFAVFIRFDVYVLENRHK